MELLKILTPEQLKSLSAEQLLAIMNVKRNRVPELKSLFLSLKYDKHGIIDCTHDTDKSNDNNVTKILEILHEYNTENFYLICKQSGGYGYYASNYKLFTENELTELVPENIINKLKIENVNKLEFHSNASSVGMYDEINNRIIKKTNNLYILSPHLLRAYGYFHNNYEVIETFIKQL